MDPHEGVLDSLLRIFVRTKHMPGVSEEPVPIARDEDGKGVEVASSGLEYQVHVRGRHMRGDPPIGAKVTRDLGAGARVNRDGPHRSLSMTTTLELPMATPRSRITLATALILLGACTDRITEPGPPGSTAELRIVHVRQGVGTVDVEVDGQVAIRGVAYGSSSSAVLVKSGARRLTIRANGGVVGTLDANLDSERLNHLVVATRGPQLSSRVEPDTTWSNGESGSTNPNRAYVRMIEVATDNSAPPVQLQALLVAPGTRADSVMRFGIDATVGRHGSLMAFDPGTFFWKYVAAGTSAPVLAEATFDIAGGQTKAIVLSRRPGGEYQVDVVTEP